MKKYKKNMIVVGLIVCIIPNVAYAYNLLSGYYPFNSRANTYYYVQVGTVYQHGVIDMSVARWRSASVMSTTWHPMSASSNIGIYSDDYGDMGWAGWCVHPQFWQRNLAFIDINDYYCYSGRTNYTLNVVQHELGHAYGLDHHPSSSSIMYEGANENVLFPDSDSVAGVNYIYQNIY